MSEKVSITKSIERAFEILECFLDHNSELSMMEITNYCNLPQSTAHRLIATLENQQYLKRNPENKKYYLGTKIVQLGAIGIKGYQANLRTIALPHMIKLRDLFNESVTLFVPYDKYRVCIERVEPERPLKTVLKIGERLLIDKGSSGKILLAYMSEENRKAILKDYDDKIASTLAEVKEQGYAISIGERDASLGAISAPIFDAHEDMIIALSISGPIDRIYNNEMERKIEIVKQTCHDISNALGYRKR
ncbi:MAG: IclR family transcriptional regulator [Tissierellales bacterium]|nr:IclR family transcriptional regulator [Tissierellales bacterium]MBN2827925.1 IclR family transcriptional regulator [Tissierellales bacterium]